MYIGPPVSVLILPLCHLVNNYHSKRVKYCTQLSGKKYTRFIQYNSSMSNHLHLIYYLLQSLVYILTRNLVSFTLHNTNLTHFLFTILHEINIFLHDYCTKLIKFCVDVLHLMW